MVNPIIAAICSFVIPGLGQALAGDIKKGIILLVIALIMVAIATLIFRHWLVTIIELAIMLYAAYDAYQMAQ
ncbi:MAG: hypothetical protein IKV87_01790 [Methanobrevibacter sp.]|nr:hypothetical protein [Methanobrevibacter sp.]